MIKRIWQFLSPDNQKKSIVLLVFSLIGALFETVGIGMVLPLIGLMTAPEVVMNYEPLQPILNTLGDPSPKKLFFICLAIFSVIYFLILVYKIWFVWKVSKFTNRLKNDTASRLFTHYLHQSWVFHLQRHSSELTQNVTKEIELLTTYGFIGTLNLVRECFLISVITILLILVNPLISLFVVVSVAPIFWLFQYSSKLRVKLWAQKRLDIDALRLKCIQESFSIVKYLKLYKAENLFINKFKQYSESSSHIDNLQGFMRSLPKIILEFYIVILIGGMIFGMLYLGFHFNEMAPILSLFVVAFLRIMPSINQLLVAIHGIRYIEPVIQKVESEFNTLNNTIDTYKDNTSKTLLNTSIDIKALSFYYKKIEKLTLNNINFLIPAGSFTAIIGSTGSGKSTLINILLGLLTPQKGSVLIDNVDIQKDIHSWQNNIAYVGQDVIMIDDTIRSNIALGLNDIDDDKIWQALEDAQIAEKIRQLPEQLDTLLGEKGNAFSGGEKQRLSIARAFYLDRPILLLDEITSSLDETNERLIMNIIKNLKGKKTIIMVTHRMNTIKECDQIIKLKEGNIRSM